MSLDFVNQHVFLIYTETAQNSREEPNEFADLLFWRLSLCLSRESLSCDTRALDFCILLSLCFYTSDTFRPILALFTYFTLHQLFLMYIATRNIFLIADDAVAWNLIIIFNFSSQRPHLNYTFFSNVYSFWYNGIFRETKLLTCSYLPSKLQAMLLLFNKGESLEYTKFVDLKLGAILFYIGIHFKPLKLWKNIYVYREDLKRHIPQKINEFASLALAGRYP